jgi:DUF4097 and DUF4098 domain-containing protein YvlB
MDEAAVDQSGARPARLTIAARSGSIVVRAGAGPAIEARGGKVRVEPDGSTRIDGGSSTIEVVCPEGSDLILGTSSGRVTLEGSFGDVRVTNSSGSVYISEARSVDLRVRSGSIEIESCLGECHVVAVSGRIEIGSAGRVDVEGTSGTIIARSVAGGRVRTTSGKVRIGLDRAADLDVRGVSSSMHIDLPDGVAPDLQLRTLSGKVKKDVEQGHDCVISAHTVSGSITVGRV